ncbi:MAG: hypothetical protein ASARMPRED_004452 [Alectoria sarmentosa]|nr:MAG: hypothetical protein ASARMPRED_004452 [Alectoria sarmentosa]
MAFVFSSLSKPKDGEVKVDIVCVPAIGADPRKTWERQTDSAGFEHRRLDYVLHDRLYPDAQVHLYDHLTRQQRSLEVKPPRGPNDHVHKRSAEEFAAGEALVADYGVAQWADRFLEIVQEHRRAQRTDRRLILFICHSTGGNVVKQALSKNAAKGQNSIAACCLGVTFFSTPHHGSSVLSEPEYVQTVQNHLGLKWEMSESLRHDFLLRNTDLETLNHRFAVSVFGVKIYSYVETTDTNLIVLSTNDLGGEALTTIRLCVVDSRSGKLSSPEAPFEDEEVIQLNSTHVGAPRFTDEDTLYSFYIDEITAFVKGFSADERSLHHALNHDIMTNTEVDVHQFYVVGTQGEPGSMKIITAHPSLQTFLEIGPSKCMEARVRGTDQVDQRSRNGSVRPAIELRPASEPAAPTLTVTSVESDEASSDASRAESYPKLSAPVVPTPKNIHTRRPSLTTELSDPESPGHLAPKPTKKVAFTHTINMDSDQARRPQRAHLFQLPSASSERFQWIHVPFTHAGWVPHVLTAISQDKDDLTLHTKLLMDKMWFSQHNQSRHASPHARFVRPSVKCLLPKSSEKHLDTGMTTPLSAIEDIQFVAYLPYLHWDTFRNLQKRAEIIKLRREQPHARPIAKHVASGKSMEHKLIWQHLTSDRPVHCRRTLDQYGYPSLRNTSVRDADQILYKRTKPDADMQPPKELSMKHKLQSSRAAAARQSSMPNADDGVAKVLMVDQLWLWIVDNKTVITFFAPKEKEENDGGLWKEGDLRSEIYQDINGDYANQCADPFDFAALAVYHAVKALLDRTTDRNLQVFRIFEEYISILTEQQTLSFKEFRNNHQYKKAKDINAQQHIDNRKDLDALLELRDIEDELNTIDKLIKEQQSCVLEMIRQYRDLNARHFKGFNGINFLCDIDQFLTEHKEQLDGMLKGAQAAQKAFKELLDMKQKQANIVEAHLAREQTEVAADQSRSVMIFTIFTIIFLPLSFFASVFGINAREWSGQPGNENTSLPTLHEIFTYMGAISLAVIVIALMVAFNRHARRLSYKVWKFSAKPYLNLLRRLSIISRHPPDQSSRTPTLASGEIDLEKQAAVDADKARAKRLSTLSRTYSKMNWEEELRQHRNSMVGK